MELCCEVVHRSSTGDDVGRKGCVVVIASRLGRSIARSRIVPFRSLFNTADVDPLTLVLLPAGFELSNENVRTGHEARLLKGFT
jgi:hypothetical protein